jgi:uncharacterized membrane protein YccC
MNCRVALMNPTSPGRESTTANRSVNLWNVWNGLRKSGGQTSAALSAIAADFRRWPNSPARAIDEAECVVSVLLAIALAEWLHVGNIGWAAFSGYMVMRSHVAESLSRGVLRVLGTTAGAVAALLVVDILPRGMFASSIELAFVGFTTLYLALVGKRSYAWLFTGITFCMVLIDGWQHPESPLSVFAKARIIEVFIGTLAAIVVSALSTYTIRTAISKQRKESPALTYERSTRHWHRGALIHALQGALALALIPPASIWFTSDALNQSSITIMAVMMVPLASLEASMGPSSSKLIHRFLGCSLGALFSTCVLLSGHASPIVMTVFACVAIALGRHIESGPSSYKYVGTQCVLAVLVILVPDAYDGMYLAPGLERLSGVAMGMLLLEPVRMMFRFGLNR